MSFMKPEVLHDEWWECETNYGTEWIPASLVDNEDALLDFIEGMEMYECEKVVGYGARLSANGYLDKTEWCVYDTEEDAWQSLLNNYDDTFVWYWQPGHGYHLYCPNAVCANVVKQHFQSINGCMIEQDVEFLYTVDDSEEPTNDVMWEEV